MEPKADGSTDNLTDKEKLLFEKVREGSLNGLKCVIADGDVHIDCLDSHGMTPLQHAAYAGNYEICKLLLDYGADVNSNHHEHKYSTLMFAAVSGKLSVVSLLLENGASTTVVNSINRTASQLAAFVGNHEVVSLINNFIPREEIDTYTVIEGKEKEPKLPPLLAKPVHQLVIKTNINPVRLAMHLQENMLLVDETKKVTRVLDHLSGKQLNDNGNELLSMKLHHLAFVIRACEKFREDEKKKYPDNKDRKVTFEALIKHWIRGGNDQGFPMNLERFMRQSIRDYRFHDCALFHQLVRTLAPVNIGDEPSAVSLFNQAVLGQRGLDDVPVCSTCGEPKADKKCAACRSVQYCDKYCQKLHWFTHKTICQSLNKKRLEQEGKQEEVESELAKQETKKEEVEVEQNAENESKSDIATASEGKD